MQSLIILFLRFGGAGSVRDQQSQPDSADRRLVLRVLLLLQGHDEGVSADQSEQGGWSSSSHLKQRSGCVFGASETSEWFLRFS